MWVYIYNYVTIMLYDKFLKDKKMYVAIAMTQSFLILALRSPELGVDVRNYSAGYEYISNLGFLDLVSRLHFMATADLVHPFSYESGYTFINWIIAKIGCSFQVFLIFHAAFCTFSFGKFINRYSCNPQISFAIFLSFGFFIYSFCILRQTLAIAVLLFAIPYIEERKLSKFIVIILFSFTIHRTAIILLPIYFLFNIELTKKKYKMALVLVLIFMIVSPIFLNKPLIYILKIFGKSRYQFNFQFNNLMILLVLIAIFILLFIKIDDLLQNKFYNNIFLWGLIISVFVETIGMFNDVLARAVQIPMVTMITFIPNAIEALRTKKNNSIKLILIFLLFSFMILNLNGSPIVPYISIFE